MMPIALISPRLAKLLLIGIGAALIFLIAALEQNGIIWR